MKVFLIASGCAVLLLFLASAAVAAVLFCKGVRRPKIPAGDIVDNPMFAEYRPRMKEGVAWFYGMQPETVWLTSYDGLRLHAYLLRHPAARGSVLFSHGYLDNGVRDFSCVLRFFYDSGCNLLLSDQRACGQSEGVYMTFGVRERRDLCDWARYAGELFGTRLPLFFDGISMGASTVLMASELDLPENVVGLIADCGFTSPDEIFRQVLRQYTKLPAFPILPMVGLLTRCFAGFGLRECSTLTAMAHNRLPVLFAHGEKDSFVPAEMTRRAYEACRAEKQLAVAPQAEHGMAYLMETERYNRLLTEFLNRHIAAYREGQP